MISKKLFYKIIKCMFLGSLLNIYFYTPTYAYFDPVTTTTIIQGLVALIAAVILYIKNPKQIIVDLKNLFTRNKKRDDDKKNENK